MNRFTERLNKRNAFLEKEGKAAKGRLIEAFKRPPLPSGLINELCGPPIALRYQKPNSYRLRKAESAALEEYIEGLEKCRILFQNLPLGARFDLTDYELNADESGLDRRISDLLSKAEDCLNKRMIHSLPGDKNSLSPDRYAKAYAIYDAAQIYKRHGFAIGDPPRDRFVRIVRALLNENTRRDFIAKAVADKSGEFRCIFLGKPKTGN